MPLVDNDKEAARLRDEISSMQSDFAQQLGQFRTEYEKIALEMQLSMGVSIERVSRELDPNRHTRNWQKFINNIYRQVINLVRSAGNTLQDSMGNTARKLSGDPSFQQVGTMLGQNIGRMMGGALGGALGSVLGTLGSQGGRSRLAWLGAATGEAVGKSAVSWLQTQENYRMLGAQNAVSAMAGRGYRSDFRELGAEITRQVLDTRKLTGETVESSLQMMQTFSRLGVGYAEGSSHLRNYTLAAREMFNTQKGVIEGLTTMALERGEEWTVSDQLEKITGRANAFSLEAQRTGSSMYRLLGVNSQLIEMYAEVAKKTKDTSISLDGLAEIFTTSVGQFSSMGYRPGRIAELTADVVKSLTPESKGSIEEEFRGGYYLQHNLGQVAEGRSILAEANNFAVTRGYDPRMLPFVFQQMQVNDPMFSKRLFHAQIAGFKERYKTFKGSKGDRWQQLVGYIMAVTGMQWPAARGVADFALGQSAPGVTEDAVMQLMGKIGPNRLSVEENIRMLVEKTLTFTTSYFDNFARDGRELWVGLQQFLYGDPKRSGDTYNKVLDDIIAVKAKNRKLRERLQAYERLHSETGADADDMPVVPEGAGGPGATVTPTTRSVPVGTISYKTASGVQQVTIYARPVVATKYDRMAEEAAAKYGVDPTLVKAMLRQESGGDPNAVSSKGAGGLMQLMPGTAREQGVTDIFDPQQNIEGGTKYIGKLLQQYGGDRVKALAAYNAGPGRVNAAGGIPNIPETQDYVARVLGYQAGYQRAGN